MSSKRQNGAYFTIKSPFDHPAFVHWLMNYYDNSHILEPFAGANNLVAMFNAGYHNPPPFDCFDISPSSNPAPNTPVIQIRNTIQDYPKNYSMCITNPPYLAKNSASRRKLNYEGGEYEDTYQKCLELMLANHDFVAVIIPESFLTQNLFFDRLESVIILNDKFFNDTEVPTCLALFVKEHTTDFDIYLSTSPNKIGSFYALKKNILSNHKPNNKIKFNDPNGILGLQAIDSQYAPSIRFCKGETIPPTDIKISSRAITRITVPALEENQLDDFIEVCNTILGNYRQETFDLFMTSFKGLRKDQRFRRRLDFATANKIIQKALIEIEN